MQLLKKNGKIWQPYLWLQFHFVWGQKFKKRKVSQKTDIPIKIVKENIDIVCHFLYYSFNPNKAGLFEGSFFWGSHFDQLFIFQEELI